MELQISLLMEEQCLIQQIGLGKITTALNSGNYSALVTDNNGCTNTLNFNISEPSAISIVIDSFKTSCFGYSDGSAILTISGGFPPFIENWFGQNPLALDAGTHNFEITDANNCIQSGIATIYEPNEITTNEITSDVLCFGEDNGTAYLQISGGTSPYIEDWNGQMLPNSQLVVITIQLRMQIIVLIQIILYQSARSYISRRVSY